MGKVHIFYADALEDLLSELEKEQSSLEPSENNTFGDKVKFLIEEEELKDKIEFLYVILQSLRSRKNAVLKKDMKKLCRFWADIVNDYSEYADAISFVKDVFIKEEEIGELLKKRKLDANYSIDDLLENKKFLYRARKTVAENILWTHKLMDGLYEEDKKEYLERLSELEDLEQIMSFLSAIK